MAEDDVRLLLRQHVTTVSTLEILLFMRREAGRTWTEAALERELRASRALVGEGLRRLVRAGLVQGDGEAWRYRPVTADLAEICDRLERAYRLKPVSIVNLIAAPHSDATG